MHEINRDILISFDLSTVTCGYCISDFSTEEIIELNYYDFKKKNILEKLIELEYFIDNTIIKNHHKIHAFIIEERLKSFNKGGTNANAMLKLSIINYCCQFMIFKKGIPIKEINVNTARSLAFEKFHTSARLIGTKQKEYAFKLVVAELGKDRFPTKVNKSGKNKGKTVFLDEARDMADAYILNKSGLKILKGE